MSNESISTAERLARTLEALNDPRLRDMIAKARVGYYDDYKSPLATPELQLINDLLGFGHVNLAQRVANDEFSATHEEAEAWAAIAEAGGEKVIDQMMRETFTPGAVERMNREGDEMFAQWAEEARRGGDLRFKRGRGRRNDK